MTAILLSIFGSLKGSTFALTEEETSIGRDESNSISIADRLLSRRHCKICKEGSEFRITDVGSRNGIFVNDIPVSGTILRHGDEIELGDSIFIFLLGDAPEPQKLTQLNEALIAASTTQLKADDAFYLKPERLHKSDDSSENAFHYLGVLLKMSTVIHSIPDSEMLHKQLLQLTFELIPAEWGALVVSSQASNEPSIIHAADRASKSITNIQISQSIVSQVMRERTALLGNNVSPRQPTDAASVHSALCVPLIAFDDLLGVMYFDSGEQKDPFNEFHLQLAWGIASIGAVAMKNVLDRQKLIDENKRLQADAELNMVGESSALDKVRQLVARAAPTDSTILIRGESGTGKELVARAIHRNSSRAQRPFVAINCASLTETLLESELFGHERGAFTGAIAQKKGKLEIADGGSVFLDEVSEIPISVQAKLLRLIQEREFERLGGTRRIKVDIRFIAASNRDLEQAIRTGNFRNDLFYRLNVIRIEIPPLRERIEDIPLLAKYFISQYSKAYQRRVKGISPDALECLMEHDWPGNVRELENLIERAVVLGSGDLILREDLPEEVREMPSNVSNGLIQIVKEKKKALVVKALKEAGGNYSEAAKLLGVHPNYLYRLLRSLGLNKREA